MLIADAIIAVLTIAASYGIMRKLEADDLKKLNKDPNARDLASIANKVLSAASAKGSSVLTKIAEKVNAITIPFGVSSDVRQYLQAGKKKLLEKKEQAQALVDDISPQMGAVQGGVSAHSMLTDHGKNTEAGSAIREQVYSNLDDIQKNTDKLTEIEKTL